jgi:hypothetical protein
MKLKYLVISDTHVGEPNSLLSFPRGLQELWFALRTNFANEGDDPLVTPIEVEDLILLGDIPDRTLSSTSQIQTQTGALVRTLLSAVKPKKLVYVMGNHDHTLWTNYLAGSPEPGEDVWGASKARGQNIIKPELGRKQSPKVEELLSIFFEYPYGSAWNDIVEGFSSGAPLEFVLANPLYAEKFRERLYIFTHGTYIRWDVCVPEVFKELLAASYLPELLADLTIDPGGDVTEASDLIDYEYRAYRFVDTLWPSARNNPLTKADEIWVLRRQLRLNFDEPRDRPDKTALIAWDDLSRYPERIKLLCNPADSSPLDLDKGNLNRLQDLALKHMLNYVTGEIGSLETVAGLTFVYGDTHDGGFADIALNTKDLQMVAPKSIQPGRKIGMHVVNTGAWLVDSRDRHPACHVFAVDETGKEYLLDVSYKDIRVGDDLLLTLAEMQVDQRLNRVGTQTEVIARAVKHFFGQPIPLA